jgi:predicted RNase H-like HicB family nuclease
MNKELDYYMGLSYRMEVTEDKDEGGFAFSCPDLKGCITCADTLEEGYRMLEDAKREWFAACIEEGMLIPEPVFSSGYSGQFKIRMPKSLHKALAEHAKDEGVSMNQYCLYLLSQGDPIHSLDAGRALK